MRIANLTRIVYITLLLLFPLCTSAQTVNDPSLQLTSIVPKGTFFNPTSLMFLGPDDLLVAEHCGVINRVLNGQATEIMRIPSVCGGENGFTYLLPDPDFASNKFIYISHIEAANQYRITRYRWNGSTLVEKTAILTLNTFSINHVGGAMAFGPPNVPASEQKLFLIVGDQNASIPYKTVNLANGAEPDDLGIIVRINKDGSIPNGTDRGPFYDVAAGNVSLQRTYAYGIRNSYGLTFDPVSNELWDTENGPSSHEEVNRVTPGMNSGWKVISGHSSKPSSFQFGDLSYLVYFGNPQVGEYSDPEFTFRSRGRAPTAILFLDSDALGVQFKNDCFVATFGDGLWRFKMTEDRMDFALSGNLADKVFDPGDNYTDNWLISTIGDTNGITDMRVGPDGLLYLLFFDGQIGRLQPSSAVDGWHLY